MKTLLFPFLLLSLPAVSAEVYTFTVPAGVNVATNGTTITGWGYSIQNQSSSLWLVTQNLSVDTFRYASPEGLFDFPDIAPGSMVTVPFDFGTGTGLYQITWDANVPIGFVNSGSFILEAQWWSGDPHNGGRLISQAPNASQPYSARLNAVPEPATMGLLASAIALLGLWRWRKSKAITEGVGT